MWLIQAKYQMFTQYDRGCNMGYPVKYGVSGKPIPRDHQDLSNSHTDKILCVNTPISGSQDQRISLEVHICHHIES